MTRFAAQAALLGGAVSLSALALGAGACSAGNEPDGTGASGSGTSSATNGQGGGIPTCPRCDFDFYVDCDGNTTNCAEQDLVCAPTIGCAACVPGERSCQGNQVVECSAEGQPNGAVIETCDVNAGLTCENGACKTACQIAADQPSNVGCEFWAVDLDQQDGAGNNPAAEPWGVALSNAGTGQANVTIQINTAPVGAPPQLQTVVEQSVAANSLVALTLPTRELDCGPAPGTMSAPGTCLSSNAFRITSSAPIVVYQFNVFENAFSNDASLLLPTNALGTQYRVMGWNAGHPVKLNFPGLPEILTRSYVTIVGAAPDTQVTVRPTWKIKGNAPIPATAAGGELVYTIGPFDVLNLESDDGTLSDDPKTIADFSGSYVLATKPVAVFSGTELTSVRADGMPTYPGWDSEDTCCLDHLEEQLFPLESLGKNYVVTRSPVRSTSSFREPDVIRFVGAAEPANITTSLPAPFNSFTLQPGEVRTTWAQNNFTATGDKPFMVGQYLVSQGYVDGPLLGDPSMTIFPTVEQYRTQYVILTPGSWSQNWVIISAEVGTAVLIDGAAPSGCTTEPAGTIEGKTYESIKCPLAEGAHQLSGDKPIGIVAYGYGNAGSYAFAGGADVERIYEPPIPQ
jgi:hypothetical protein